MFPAQMVALKIHDKLILGDIRKQIPLFQNGPTIEERIKILTKELELENFNTSILDIHQSVPFWKKINNLEL